MVIMSDMGQVLLLFVVALFATRLLQTWILRLRSLPPGPIGLPFLGFLPYMSANPPRQFSNLAHKYGSIFSVKLGRQLVVVLADYKVIRKAFGSEQFLGRPGWITSVIEGYGVINVSGKLWKDQRRFLHERLRNAGMKTSGTGREHLEARINLEVKEFINALALRQGQAVDLNTQMTLTFTNVMCSMLMNVRFRDDDPRFVRLMELIEEGFKLVSMTGASNFLPCLRNLPHIQKITSKLNDNLAETANIFRGIVEDREATFDENNIRDIVDSYILEIKQARQEGRTEALFEGKDPDRQVLQILADMISAGVETVKTTVHWAILYMLHNPTIMQTVQDELDSVVGRDRLPSLEDLPYLPYTEATMCEVLRHSGVVPMGTTHTATADVQLEGFCIPKDTQVIPLICAIHHDTDLWNHPQKFDPSRFLDGAGRVFKPEFFIPFGVGRRMCLGEIMARMEFFLFFTSLLHVFQVQVAPGTSLPSTEGVVGFTFTPRRYYVQLTARQGPLCPGPHPPPTFPQCHNAPLPMTRCPA